MADFPCFYKVKCRWEFTLKCFAWVLFPSVSRRADSACLSRGTVTLAQALWDQYTRVHDKDDEGAMFVVKIFRLIRSRRPASFSRLSM